MAGSAVEWLTFKLDDNFSIERDQTVFMLGKKLYNNRIMPIAVFKKLSTTKFIIPLTLNIVKKIAFSLLLVGTLAATISKIYWLTVKEQIKEKNKK